jgi:hypothetical protein
MPLKDENGKITIKEIQEMFSFGQKEKDQISKNSWDSIINGLDNDNDKMVL